MKVCQEMRARWSLDNLEATSVEVMAPVLDPRFQHMKYIITDDELKMAVKDEIVHKMNSFASNQPIEVLIVHLQREP